MFKGISCKRKFGITIMIHDHTPVALMKTHKLVLIIKDLINFKTL